MTSVSPRRSGWLSFPSKLTLDSALQASFTFHEPGRGIRNGGAARYSTLERCRSRRPVDALEQKNKNGEENTPNDL